MTAVGCPSLVRVICASSVIHTHVLCLPVPYYAVPWAATIINHPPSFLAIHGLFFLARRDIDRFFVLFATGFVDLIHHIDEQWDMLVSCIRDGIIPDLEGIDHVREYLQASQQPIYMSIISNDLCSRNFKPIPNVRPNCLKSVLHPPVKDGPTAFGQN